MWAVRYDALCGKTLTKDIIKTVRAATWHDIIHWELGVSRVWWHMTLVYILSSM